MTFSDQPEREPNQAPSETVLSETTVTVRRSPRIVNFLILGAVLGALTAVILTYAFPENQDFNRTQVLGFLLLGCVAVGIALASLVALILGRIVARKAVTVVADRIGTTTQDADTVADASASETTSRPLSSGTTPSGTTPPDAKPSGDPRSGTTPSSTTSENF